MVNNNAAERQLLQAAELRAEARARMHAARVGSKRWAEAEADLNFWQGKVASLSALLQLYPVVRTSGKGWQLISVPE